MALTRKLVSFKIFTSNHFQTHVERERERERESPDPTFDFADLQTHEPIFDPWAFDFAGDPQPSRHKPTNRFLSLCDFDFLCDFDRPMNHSTFLCDFDFLLSLWSLIFLLLWWWWVVVFWWFSCCVVVGFAWVVMKNSIFRTLLNTWKYFLEQFS